MKKPKTLVIHASFGQGHKQAALAISSHLKVPCHDLLDFTLPVLKKIQSAAYLYLTKNLPWLWRFLFNLARLKIIEKLLAIINFLTYFPFVRYLRKENPKILISTHFFPPRIANLVKDKLEFIQIVIVTDIRPHPQWAAPGIDKFFVPTLKSKQWLTALGINPDKIKSGYIALREGFLKNLDPVGLYQKFNLDPKRKTLLLVPSTSKNFQLFQKAIENFIRDFNLIIIYGKNEKLKNYLNQLKEEKIKSFSFYSKMWELVSISKVIVAKPGGLTVFEGVYKEKFFVFTHFIPGQEEENLNFLKKFGLAQTAFSAKDLITAVKNFAARKNQPNQEYPVKFKDIRDPLSQLIEKYG